MHDNNDPEDFRDESGENMPESKMIFPLDGITDELAGVAGGKASALSKLIFESFQVPSGFCISAEVYRSHVNRNNIDNVIKSSIQEYKAGIKKENIFSKVRRMIAESELSSEMNEIIVNKLKEYDGFKFAVRSSATFEDMPLHSFAGMYDSFTGLEFTDDIIDSVKKCWASLWTDRAFFYREKEALDHFSCSMAVIIQRYIEAESSGVVFTADPVSGNKERIIIEMVEGGCEHLVSGKLTPKRVVLSKPDLQILESTKEVPVAHLLVMKIANLAMLVEKVFKGNVDIEWLIKGNDVYLLQARPITAMNTVKENDDPEGYRIWTNANIGEVLPDVVTPVTWSFVKVIIKAIFNDNFRSFGVELGDEICVTLIAGRGYFDLTSLSSMFRQIPGMKHVDITKIFGGYQDKVPVEKIRPAVMSVKPPKINVFKMFSRFFKSFLKFISYALDNGKRFSRKMKNKTDEIMNMNISSLSGKELVTWIRNIVAELLNDIEGFFVVAVGMFYYQSLYGICRKWLSDSETGNIANKLMSSAGNIDSALPGFELFNISSFIKENPEIMALIKTNDSFLEIRSKIEKVKNGNLFIEKWNYFMKKYGHHTRGEIELSNKRWMEMPDYILGIIRNNLLSMEKIDPMEKIMKNKDEQKALLHDCLRKLSNPFKRIIFRFVLKQARWGVSAREFIKSEAIRRMTKIRFILLDIGSRLKERNLINDRDDIFFMYLDEIEKVIECDNDEKLRTIIKERKKEYQENLLKVLPPVIIGEPECEYKDINYYNESAKTLKGLSVCPGKTKGPARIILRENETTEVLPGEILVIPYSDPGWTPYFITSSGIVMDMGGLLSHGCIIAREYGIPTVVNVGSATKLIKNGQVVEVDGNLGVVNILDE